MVRCFLMRERIIMGKKKRPKLPSSGHRTWKHRGGLHDPRPNRRRQRGQARRRHIAEEGDSE